MNDLIPCPFCGSHPTYHEYDPFDGYQGNCIVHEARCPHCGAMLRGKNKEDVIRKWNTRKEINCEACRIERRQKVYISGPITGTDDYQERFARAEEWLTEHGYEAVNPAKENAKLPEGTTWKQYMGEALRLLMGCDKIFMLKGWSGSRGATLELRVAERVRMDVLYAHMEGFAGVVEQRT